MTKDTSEAKLELNEKRIFNGNSYYGRYVNISSEDGKSENVLIFEEALYEQIGPFINGEKEIRDSDDREAIFLDDEIYAYVPREILQKDDKNVIAWCKDNGIDIGNVPAVKEYTWNDLYNRAIDTAYGDPRLKAKDNARSYIGDYAKEHFNIDIESFEIPEDAIDTFLEAHPELDRFNAEGQMLAALKQAVEVTKDVKASMDISSYKSKLKNFDKNDQTRLLQKLVEYALDANAIELPEVEYSRENYNKYFSMGQIESPIATLKMGGNQFEKFAKPDRKI